MSCKVVRLEDGVTAIVCSRGSAPAAPAPCSAPSCGKPHTRLCDAKVGSGTCDARLCADHAFRSGPDEDRCPEHACRLCQRIAEDLALHGRLTDGHPEQGPIMMEPLFPVEAKIAHLVLEKFGFIVLDGTGRAVIINVE